jgi:hypothetical protein
MSSPMATFWSICLVVAVVGILPGAVQGYTLRPVAAFAVRPQQQLQLQQRSRTLHTNNGPFSSRHGLSSLLQPLSSTSSSSSDDDSDNQVFDADRQFALSRIKTHKSEKDDPEWKFFDTARIHVSGGDGGTGCVAFRREKGESRGGPYGGRGGRGGSVFLEAVETLNTLMPCRQRVHVRAHVGKRGSGKNRDGCHGDDIIIQVPPGTLVRDLKTQKLAGELREPGDRLLVAKGGRGGRGNAVRRVV